MAKAEQTFFDKVIERSQALNRGIVDKVVTLVPQPPGRQKLTEREQLQRYKELERHPEEMQKLIAQHGEAAVNNYIFQMWKLQQKYPTQGGV